MKVKLEINLQKPTYQLLQKLAEALNMHGGIEELLSREVGEYVDNIELWLDRAHILQTRFPSFFVYELRHAFIINAENLYTKLGLLL